VEEELTALKKLINTVIEFCVNYSFQVVGAIIVLIVGFIVASWVSKLLLKVFEKRKFDVTLSSFLVGIIKGIIIVFAVLISLGKFGITITPFVAALGALAFGASFAIQGPLANYGAGISIILGRPFVVGDTIFVKEQSGVVEEVKLACTILTNEDGVKITIPNKHIIGEILHNSKANKIVEGVIGISYGTDPNQAIQAVTDILGKYKEVRQDPPPQVGIQNFGDSSIDIGYRYWIPTIQYFKLSYAINKDIFSEFKNQNVTIPFPQQDLHIVSGSEKLSG